MRILVFLCTAFIIKQGTGTTYNCDPNAACGCSTSSTVVTRIVGGEIVVQESWSWTVSLRDSEGHFCGGSILSSDYVITAAHCLMDTTLDSITVLAGSRNLQPTLSDSPQIRSIAQAYKHPQFNTIALTNDLALLRLIRPFNMTNTNIRAICLPSENTPQPPDNIDLVAVGWGKISLNETSASSVLRQVTLQSIEDRNSQCQILVTNTDMQFCAGVLAGGKDTCQGDSGGPLMRFVNDVWQLDGITSFGWQCALPKTPAVYTRVSYYIDWIQSTIASGGIDTTTATTTTMYTVNTTSVDKMTQSNFAAVTLQTASFISYFFSIVVILSLVHQ